MSSTCSTSILGWEDVHCQTSRFEIDKQSCPRALQPHVNTHSLDPSSAWSCTKQASTGACSLRKNLSLCCFCFNIFIHVAETRHFANKKCCRSMLGWEDVHCQTSRFKIDKQSCPRALQPHVNTHSLDPSSAWGCPKQAATRAGSSQDHRSYQNSKEPLQTNVKHVFYKYIRLGRCSLPNFKIRDRQAIMSEGFTTPREHTLPGPLLRLGLPQTGCYQSWLLTGP